jgi:hypothetical protein
LIDKDKVEFKERGRLRSIRKEQEGAYSQIGIRHVKVKPVGRPAR